MLAGLALPLAAQPALATTKEARLASDVASLIDRADRANAAFMNGDMTRWHQIAGPIAPDFTLMQPFGGAASHGFDASPARLEAMAREFAGGQTRLELAATYASIDLVVLVFIERQRARVGGLPEQDWSLRVTHVYRRQGDVWEWVHRHADPLAHKAGLAETAALAART